MRLGIQVQGISKKMGDQKILNNVDMECPCKSITGIIGRNGSGKNCIIEKALRAGYIGALIKTPDFLSNCSGLKKFRIIIRYS